MSVLTPNMSLYQPVIGTDSGLVWEQDMNANASILDNHNHSPGSGAQISPPGLNINAELDFQSQNAINLRTTRYTGYGANLAGPLDLGCLYVVTPDLWFNDTNGNQVKITTGGVVNATSSGISSGTNTASFVSNVLVVNQASNTPASIKGGSVLLGNTGVAASNYVTLSPPGSTSNYNLTLPQVASLAAICPMTINTSGVMSSITYDSVGQGMTVTGANAIGVSMNATGANAIGVSMTATGANAVANTRTRATNSATVAVGGVAISVAGSGGFTTTSTTMVPVTNLSVTITTAGRPVMVLLVPDSTAVANNGSSGSFIRADQLGSTFAQGAFQLARGGVGIGQVVIHLNTATSGGGVSELIAQNPCFHFVDPIAAGTYTYTINAAAATGAVTMWVAYLKLMAYEL